MNEFINLLFYKSWVMFLIDLCVAGDSLRVMKENNFLTLSFFLTLSGWVDIITETMSCRS